MMTSRYVRITSGKFRGWRGWPMKGTGKGGYYNIMVAEKIKRGRIIKPDDVGLGIVVNVPKHHIKDVIR